MKFSLWKEPIQSIIVFAICFILVEYLWTKAGGGNNSETLMMRYFIGSLTAIIIIRLKNRKKTQDQHDHQ